MALLNINQLSVHFGDEDTPFKAVDRISYQVEEASQAQGNQSVH